MNIKGVTPSNLVNLYSKNSSKINKTSEVKKLEDRIEISKLGKQLNSFNLEGIETIGKKDIEKLREKVSSGTYNVDAKLTAKSILETIKESKL